MYDLADTERIRTDPTEMATWPPGREAVWIWDVRSSEITWNEGLSVFFGHRIPNNRTSFAWWTDHVHPDDRARIDEAATRAIAGETGLRVAYRLLCGDGSYAEVIASATVVRDPDGSVHRIVGAIVDVTEQRRTAEAARTSEALFSAAFDAGPVPSIITSLERRTIIDANDAFTRAFGWSRREAVGATVDELGLWVDDAERVAYGAALSHGGRTRDVQVKLRSAAGRHLDMRLSSSMLEIGGERCLITAAFDVTEQLRIEREERAFAERSSRQNQALLQLMSREPSFFRDPRAALREITEIAAATLDVARVGVWLYDDRRERLSCADLFDARRGHESGASLAATTFPAYFAALDAPALIDAEDARVDPRTREFDEAYLRPHGIGAMLDAPILVGGRSVGVLCHEHVGGRRAWSADERSFATSLVALVSVVLEICERTRAEQALRASEEAYRTIVNTMLEGVWLLGLDGNTSFVNPRMAQMLGYEPAQMVGRSALDFVPTDAHERVFEYLRRLKPEQPLTADLKLLRSDGTELSVTVAATVVTNDRGEPVARLGMVTDTTERRHLEEQLRHAQRIEAVGRLAGGVAHDFNNLLTVINGYSQAILEELPASDPLREDVSAIEEAGKRAADLTRQLLTFSRKQLLTPQVVQLDAVVTSMTKMMLRLVGEDVRLDVELRGDGALVKVDPGQLEQVIANLVVNARDAMPDGGTLLVTTQSVTGAEALRRDALRTDRGSRTRVGALKDDVRYVVLSVQDDGSGMAASVRGKIFEPFFTTKKEAQGTGLGLSTVYGIMMQSGGSITVESAIDVGTSMEVYFPIERGSIAKAEPPAVFSERGRGEAVLVVEDETSVRKLVTNTLRRAGYRVVSVANAGEALMVIEDGGEPFELLLTDVVLPGVSGRRLAERLLLVRPDLRVLFMSGYTEDHVLQRGICEARSAFIAKPFAPEVLARRVREVLDAPAREAGLPTPQEE